nr:uncharacterized protein LOC131782811 isoform X1 [Pocillopora verrucosa]
MTSSSAVFVLHNVRPEDGNKYYGIHVEFDLHYPLIDTLKLQVKETSKKQRFTLKPSNPTIVYKGENVSLEWRYHHPRHMKLVEVFFGIWTNPVSAADKSLVAVNSSGAVEVREEYKSRLSWKVNVTSSVAVFVLHNVRPEDGNKYYGIHVEFDLHYPLIDTLKLQVETKHIPLIKFVTSPPPLRIGQSVSLNCVANKSMAPVKVAWYREQKVLESGISEVVVTRNITSEDFGEYTCIAENHEGEDRKSVYLRVAESEPTYGTTTKIDQTAFHTHSEIEGSVKPSVFVVEGTFSRKTEGLVDGSLVAIIIALSVSVIIFTGLGCFLRIKCKPMKENPERHQDRRGITAYSFTPEMDLTSEAAQGTVEERTSVLSSETHFGIEDTSFMAEQRETSIRNTESIYKKPRASQCLLLATFKPEMNPTALETKPYELPTGPKTFNSSEECERSNSSSPRTCLSEHNLQPSAGFENTESGRFSHGETQMVCSTRPRPKPRKKFNRKAPGTLPVECLRSNPLCDEAGVEHCARAKVSDQIDIDGSTPQTFREKTSYQNASLPKALCKNAAYQNSSQLLTAVQVESPYTLVFSNKKWEVPSDHLSLIERIGGGTFGEVWKGRGLDVCGTQGWSFVAVKMLKENFSKSDLTDLLSELDLLKKLKPHPNVIQLLGCLTKDVIRCEGRRTFKPPLVILEFVAHGDLLGFLKRSRGETDDYYDLKRKEIPRKISIQQLYKFASDIARGMEFISAHQLIHRDLAARNVLVGEGLRCKITDFGMARDLGRGEIYVRRSNGVVPVKWMAVESLTKQVFTIKSDV